MAEQRQLPPEVQQALVEYENLRNTLAKVEAELRLTESELAEIEDILANLKELPDDVEVYKSVGHVLFRKKKEDVIKELEERKELLQIKQQKYKNQVELLRKQVSEAEKKLRDLLARYGIKVG
ncbi:prefoldin subunit beta [Desulfurococcaceae archaeon MEX13E-LK6-19]|nr:prefoldin subunit beta [Desulfurococcaceae archaeon MEX13E-LK6-19]